MKPPVQGPSGHLSFNQRPVYKSFINMSIEQLRTFATQSRAAGHYNLTTLYCFKYCYLRTGRASDLLAYLLFTRDLGYPLSKLRYVRLRRHLRYPLLFLLKLKGSRTRLLQATNLLTEAQHVTGFAHKTQPLAWWVKAQQKSTIRRWRKLQSGCGNEFMQHILSAHAICIVGNSPILKNQSLGKRIDQHDLVIRFNHYRSEFTQSSDIGSKVDIWCMAPGVDKLAPDSKFVIIAGPEMLWRQQRFPQLANYQGCVLGCPLNIWRELVHQLGAPPSAGLLLTAWLTSVANLNTSTINIAGFSYDGHTTGQYHHADPTHKPVSRHHWQAEAAWLQQAVVHQHIQELT